MSKQMIKTRAEYAKRVGQQIGNDGVIEYANEVIAMCDNRKMSPEAIIKTTAYSIVLRVYYR